MPLKCFSPRFRVHVLKSTVWLLLLCLSDMFRLLSFDQVSADLANHSTGNNVTLSRARRHWQVIVSFVFLFLTDFSPPESSSTSIQDFFFYFLEEIKTHSQQSTFLSLGVICTSWPACWKESCHLASESTVGVKTEAECCTVVVAAACEKWGCQWNKNAMPDLSGTCQWIRRSYNIRHQTQCKGWSHCCCYTNSPGCHQVHCILQRYANDPTGCLCITQTLEGTFFGARWIKAAYVFLKVSSVSGFVSSWGTGCAVHFLSDVSRNIRWCDILSDRIFQPLYRHCIHFKRRTTCPIYQLPPALKFPANISGDYVLINIVQTSSSLSHLRWGANEL